MSQTFQPSRNIHAITEGIAILDNDIALVNADPQFDTCFGCTAR
jgi:hypothetical protein